MSKIAVPEATPILNGRFAQNSWLLRDPDSGDAVLIDAGEEHERILEHAAKVDATIREIWLTHAHIDHIWGTDAIRQATGAKVLIHRDAVRWYDALPEQARMFGVESIERLAAPDRLLEHGDELILGSWRFSARHTPGHAPGHLIFVGEGICFSGDLVFRDSVGRTDVAGCDPVALMRSIEEEVLTLPDETRILPGHGGATTVGRERRSNPFFPRSRPAGPGQGRPHTTSNEHSRNPGNHD